MEDIPYIIINRRTYTLIKPKEYRFNWSLYKTRCFKPCGPILFFSLSRILRDQKFLDVKIWWYKNNIVTPRLNGSESNIFHTSTNDMLDFITTITTCRTSFLFYLLLVKSSQAAPIRFAWYICILVFCWLAFFIKFGTNSCSKEWVGNKEITFKTSPKEIFCQMHFTQSTDYLFSSQSFSNSVRDPITDL